MPSVSVFTALYSRRLAPPWQMISWNFSHQAVGGDLARKSDLDALEKRLESRMDSLDSRVDAVERQIVELRNEVRALGNLRHTIVLTGASLAISLFVGLGGLMVAVVQLTGR
ncbi:MAG: hypothetical protein ACKOJH_00280 [Actinomycetota bacterium]